MKNNKDNLWREFAKQAPSNQDLMYILEYGNDKSVKDRARKELSKRERKHDKEYLKKELCK